MFVFTTVLFAAPLLSSQTNTDAPSALAPPYGELPPTFWEQHGPIILIGAILFVALAGLLVWKLLQPRSPIVLPPETIAREALTKLLRQPEDGKCLSEISQILRRYVAAAFELPSGEMTTAEFCAALAGHGKIADELAQSIPSFLRDCDERKFSPVNSGAPMNAAARALELVALAQRSAPVPGAAISKTPGSPAQQKSHNHSDIAASEDGRTP